MEEKPSESKQEENNKQTENTETSEDLTEAASVQTAEKETKPSPDITAALEEDEGEQDTFSVAPLEGALEEDVSMMTPIAETSESIAAEIESELYMMTEEDTGIPLFDDTFDDYSNTEGRLIAELLSQEDTMAAEDEEEENRPPTAERDGGYSPAGIPLVPAEEEEVDLSINNKEHIELLHELQAERDKLSKLNGQLQAKIAEYLSKNIRHDEQPRLEKDISNQEQYQKYLNLMEDLKSQHHQISERLQQRTAELQVQSQEKVDQVEDELRSFAAIKNEAAITALSGKLGKQAAMAKVEQLLAAEQKQEDELVVVRLKNIKLKYKISKFKAALHSKQELAEGLLLMDFEQLKTENQTFKNKLKERSEELLKLKKKVACTVQGITHVKEKMHFVQIENKTKYTQLAEADALVALKRDVLTRTRQARDSLRADNLKLQQRCGLLGNNTLLRDFEEKVDTSECLQQRLEILKRRHAELIMKCAGVKKKIEQSKPESK